MLDYALICTVALLVAGLTFFSGFGLGTLLMPFFALFFEVKVAIAATAVVHLLNNLFKTGLMYRQADLKVVARFAVPAALFAAIGAWCLEFISRMEPLYAYRVSGHEFNITLVNLVIACMIAVFSVIELTPKFEKLSFPGKYLPLGGTVSGFFGGLSGLQGALRSAFLIRSGLSKEVFIGTAVLSAVVVDVSRLVVYGSTFFVRHFTSVSGEGGAGLIIAGALAAFTGSFLGRRLLTKVTFKTVQRIVGVLLFVLAAALGSGLV